MHENLEKHYNVIWLILFLKQVWMRAASKTWIPTFREALLYQIWRYFIQNLHNCSMANYSVHCQLCHKLWSLTQGKLPYIIQILQWFFLDQKWPPPLPVPFSKNFSNKKIRLEYQILQRIFFKIQRIFLPSLINVEKFKWVII